MDDGGDGGVRVGLFRAARGFPGCQLLKGALGVTSTGHYT